MSNAQNLAQAINQFTGKNRFINGQMAVDQRNNGAAQTITAAAALAYTVDRWWASCAGANVTGQRVAGSGQSQYRYQFTGAASVTGIQFGQRIETINSYDLSGQTATLAVDLANSLLGTVTWTAYYATTADTFGTLASPTKTQIATGTFNVTPTVQRYNAQIAIPAAATTGIEVVFSVGAQTSGTWTIGNAQLEPGTKATTVDRRPYGMELVLCQRYLELGSLFMQSPVAGTMGTTINTVPKRSTPTWVLTGTAYSNMSGLAIVSTWLTQFGVQAVASAVAGYVNSSWSASAEL